MTDAPIFVVGVARSGTTLLSAMLSAHSHLDCGPESRFFARYRHLDARARARILDPVAWPRPAVDFIASLRNQGHPISELFGLTLPEIGSFLTERPPSPAAMLESLTVLHARRAGKARWMEKTPRHLLMTDTLRQHWPDAYIVRIVRDPRDVAMSLARMPFAKDSVVGNLVRVDHDDRISRERIEADPRAMTLRYEDLVSEPERELRCVCEFIGEVYEPGMLDSRETAGNVAAEHEWWKASVSGPLQTTSVGRWHEEMSADAQRFAALHLAGYLREHGYQGARAAVGEVALLPVADAVGPTNEGLLLELARRDLVVARPVPSTPMAQHRRPHLVFLGVKGQLDPTRGQSAAGRVIGSAMLSLGLLVRRVGGRPMLWVRGATLRPRRARDPVERLLAPLLRFLAREVSLDDVPDLVDAVSGRNGVADADEASEA
ncbi:MAG: hypothetical protein DRQ55_19280 [Planctomycetota bacterium]|nr:MAG: hypothetical protein DRQ55_19280 [Planctomycetota bacterium]